MILYFINKDYDALLLQLLLVFIYWIIVILAIGIDLHFGIKKSKERGVFVTHSYGLRKTSEKVVEYLAFMFFMLFLDILNPLFIYFEIQALPLLSTFGAIVLVYTEWKSVREKSDDKFRHAIRNNPIREMSLSNFDTTTVVGAFNYGIDKILSKYPTIKIFVFTPMFRYLNNILPENSSDVIENSLGLHVIEYVDAIKSIANLNHLTCKDLYRESRLNKYTHSTYYIDTTHPNDAGYVYLGKLTASFINSQFKV